MWPLSLHYGIADVLLGRLVACMPMAAGLDVTERGVAGQHRNAHHTGAFSGCGPPVVLGMLGSYSSKAF
jgi:hypothetical protein